jgi:glycosyltransferase involved in cell wall biosynthesis
MERGLSRLTSSKGAEPTLQERLLRGTYELAALFSARKTPTILHYLPDVSGGVASGVEYSSRALWDFEHVVACSRRIGGGAARRLLAQPNVRIVPSVSRQGAARLCVRLRRLAAVWNHVFWDLRPLCKDDIGRDVPLVTQLEAPEAHVVLGDGNVGRIVVASRFYGEIYQHPLPPGAAPSVVPMAVDTDVYADTRQSRRRDTFVIGNLTNGAPWKHAPDFIDVCEEIHQRIPACEFLLLGARRLADKAAGRPFIRILQPYSLTVPEYLSSIDVLLHKTDGVFETWCLAATEAMAAGVPVVADNRGGLKDQVVTGETGFLCSTREAFVEACQVLYEDATLYERLSHQARRRAQTYYSVAALRQHLLPLLGYAELADRTSGPAPGSAV